ncbi:uncharacterized protein LOC133287447 [Gastrolobium bilobum]|uniref:uncharacterized protein LOC133287447 n=1 Tax=Gastrolobium bilobum TaxID=150636 RepID=UPI002AB290BE|nr:uncharacterized protein LOC133287447 [Gastrolobium bilobum]
MKCWTTSLSGQKNKHAVKLSQLKLELGLFGARVGASNNRVVIEITGIARKKEKPCSSSTCSNPTTPFSSLVPFHRSPKGKCSHTTSSHRFLCTKAPSLVWDDRDLCGFHLPLKDGFCDITFHVFYGEGAAGESKGKMTVAGKVSMSIAMAELLTKTDSDSHHPFQRRLPIKLKVNGLFIEATLSVSGRLLKLRNSHDDDSPGHFESLVQSQKKHGIIGRVKKYLASLTKKNNDKFDHAEQPSPYESDGSPVFDSDDSSNESTTSSGSGSGGYGRNHNAGLRLTIGSERFTSSGTKTRLDTVQKNWSQLPLNRSFKGWNFKTDTSKQETLTTHSGPSAKSDELSLHLYLQGGASNWEIKKISSRDGRAKLKTNVFFASFDQLSEQACGEGACTVLASVTAHWLHSNHDMPTRAQFDSLIRQGSFEWRRLCNIDCYSKLFPDKHFDLETIIEANLRPLIVLPQKSYTGFFSPEKFHCLKGAMSFDEIWDEINGKVVDSEPRIYIVSWNDHFFVLKLEADAYYIIDSLGERLFEGCQQAFILKFDDSSVMYAPSKGAKSNESLEIICRGKECCKEFIKRFLAAIPLRQLEKEEKKWNVSSPYLHRQLQIDFHYSSSSSSSTSASSSLLSILTSGSL